MSTEQPQPWERPDPSDVPDPYAGPPFWTTSENYPPDSVTDSGWIGFSQPYSEWNPTPAAAGPSRRIWWIAAAAAVVVLLAVAAVVNVARHHTAGSSQAGPAPLPGISTLPGPVPSSPPSSGPGAGIVVPAVRCPVIRDTLAHLSYRCIDNSLIQSDPDEYLGLRVSLTMLVEPNWVLSEGSGDPSAYRRNPVLDAATAALPSLEQVKATVEARSARAVQDAYGPSPNSHVMAANARKFGTATGFELLTLVTMDSQFRAETGLKAKTERLWVVGVPTAAGVSIFMLSIPDDRSDLWPKAEGTIGTISVT